MTHEKLLSGDELITELIESGGVRGISQLGTAMVKLEELVVAKECNTCGIMRDIRDYGKQRLGLGGGNAKCKPCEKQHRKDIGRGNKKERVLLSEEEKKKRRYEWWLENKDTIAEKSREWRRKNPEKSRDYARQYYHNDPEARRLYNKENAEKIRAWRIQYYDRHPEKALEKVRAWQIKYPEKHKIVIQRRAARKKLLPDSLTAEEYLSTCGYFNDSCALSGETVKLHADHIIPLASGHGGTVKGNIIPMTSKLNLSKNDKNIFVWFVENKERFDLSQDKFNKLIIFLATENNTTVFEYTAYVYNCHNNPRKLNDKEAIT